MDRAVSVITYKQIDGALTENDNQAAVYFQFKAYDPDEFDGEQHFEAIAENAVIASFFLIFSQKKPCIFRGLVLE